MEFFSQNNYFSKNQFGCIKGRSTALQLLRVRFAGGVQPSQWFFYPPSPRRFELQFNFCYRLSLPWTYGKGFYDHGIHGCKMSEGVFHRTSDFSCMKIENRMHCSSYDQEADVPLSAKLFVWLGLLTWMCCLHTGVDFCCELVTVVRCFLLHAGNIYNVSREMQSYSHRDLLVEVTQVD